MNKFQSLTPEQKKIICEKGTEPPFSGHFPDQKLADGTFLCRGCGLALFRGKHKFISACGWPSFDDEIDNAILRKPDADGRRTEILCSKCQGHLGHVFLGEHLTSKNLRHCVNSISVEFVQDSTVLETEEIILAAGCFWGVEYFLKKEPGVLIAESGYTGGDIPYPNYEDVCSKKSGHLEAVRVVFDTQKASLMKILQTFFEIHDFTQTNGQGPDIGPQYLSAIFTFSSTQSDIAQSLIKQLQDHGYKVATKIHTASEFWPAETYHQDYYAKVNKTPYCHIKKSIF